MRLDNSRTGSFLVYDRGDNAAEGFRANEVSAFVPLAILAATMMVAKSYSVLSLRMRDREEPSFGHTEKNEAQLHEACMARVSLTFHQEGN